MLRVGRPWCENAHATRDATLVARRAARASPDPPSSWPSLAEFYAGRSVLITGGSGFMGRVLLEFLLRCCPDIGDVHLVLRSRKGTSPAKRLHQLTDVPLFDRLRREQPNALSKVVVVAGDVALPGLGLSAEDRAVLARRVSVVFHCAASVRFDDPFRKAVFTNLRSTRDLIQLAKEMPQLKVLVHVSTAYAVINQPVIGERVYPTHLDWRDVIRWAERLSEADAPSVDWLGHKLRDFQPNSYTFTKALAERLVEDEARGLPVVIARPSIVMSSLRDPLPGWVDNLNGPMAMFAANLKGILCVWPHGNAVLDTVPVDVATKVILLASWLKGVGKPLRVERPSDSVDVVNVTVSTDLGPNLAEYKVAVDEVVDVVPFPGAVRYPTISYYPSSKDWRYKLKNFYSHILFGLVLDLMARFSGQKPRALRIYRAMTSALQLLEPFTSSSFTFEMKNQEYLHSLVHPADEAKLDYTHMYSVRDSKATMRQLQINVMRGILKYTLREEDNPTKNLQHLRRVYWYEYIFHFAMLAMLTRILYILYAFHQAYRV